MSIVANEAVNRKRMVEKQQQTCFQKVREGTTWFLVRLD